MDMLTPDWNQECPDAEATESIWKEPVFTANVSAVPAVEELLKAFGTTHLNGGAVFGRFRFPCSNELHWFISRNRFDNISFVEHLLTSEAFRRGLPALQSPNSMEPLKLEWWSPYLLGGDLARTLMEGGAYEKYKGGPGRAMELADKARFALFEDRFEDVVIFKSSEPWSNWFYGVAWDVTWVGIDKRKMKVWTLCITDTD